MSDTYEREEADQPNIKCAREARIGSGLGAGNEARRPSLRERVESGTLDSILEMAAKNPLLAQALFQSPDNWDFFARTMGIPEITLPEARSRR